MIKVNARKKFYNEEYESEEWYTGVSKLKKVRVKDRDDLYVMHYYWKDEDGELWSDFDDPTANNRLDFIAYRQVKGYLSPEQIKELKIYRGILYVAFQIIQILVFRPYHS